MVGAAGQSDSTKALHEGKEYDFVFTVDIEEGKPPLKLPYNLSEDPWHAAQKFIHQNNLSQYYLDTVANFIIDNTKGASAGNTRNQVSGQGFADPFTGGSRYVPSGGVTTGNSRGQQGDPFTGAGRYVPREEAKQVKQPTADYFPNTEFVHFEQANLEGIKSKAFLLICPL